jgi:hypothetical protein
LIAICAIGLIVCGIVIFLLRGYFKRAEDALRLSLKPAPQSRVVSIVATPALLSAEAPAVKGQIATSPQPGAAGVTPAQARETILGFLSQWHEACVHIEEEGEEVVGSVELQLETGDMLADPTPTPDAMTVFLRNPFFHGNVLGTRPHPEETEAIKKYLSRDYFTSRNLNPSEYQIYLHHYPKFKIVSVELPYVEALAMTNERIIKNEYFPPRADLLTFRIAGENGDVRIVPSATRDYPSGQKAVSPEWEAEWRVDPTQYPEEIATE